MTETTFRCCNKADLPFIQTFVDELYSSYPGEEGVEPDITLTFSEFEKCPQKGRVIVFEQSAEVIGYAIIVFFWSNEFGGDVIEIDELLVADSCRGSGTGRAFFSWLETTYPRCVALALQVSDQNRGATRLYDRVGFKLSRNHHLLKLLPRSATRQGWGCAAPA